MEKEDFREIVKEEMENKLDNLILYLWVSGLIAAVIDVMFFS